MDTTQPPRDDRLEQLLAHWDVKWTGPIAVPLTLIDERASLTNQGRAEALDHEHVETLTLAIKQGEQMPPVLGVRRGQKVWLADGNHRTAAEKKAKVHDRQWAYIVAPTTTSEQLSMIIAAANVLHGKGTTSKWRAQQALHLLSLGWAMDDVSAGVRLTTDRIRNAVRVNQAAERAARLGILGFGNLAEHSQEQLGRIVSDHVFECAVKMVIETEFGSGDQLRQFVSAITKLPSEQAALDAVEETKQGRLFDLQRRKALNANKGRHTSVPVPKTQVLSAIGSILAIQPEKLPILFLTEIERREVRSRLSAAAVRLMEMEEVLEKDC